MVTTTEDCLTQEEVDKGFEELMKQGQFSPLQVEEQVCVIFAGTPTATVAYIMAQQMRGDAELSGSIIMLSTLLSLITYTVALVLLEGLGL